MVTAGVQVKVTPLCGVYGEDPLSYILEVDDFTFLLDCGWNDKLDLSLLEPLKEYVDRIDAVLLSFPDTVHLGALPYAVGKLGLDAAMYATLPTHKMGLMYMYDQYNSRQDGEAPPFDLDDVDLAFGKLKTLKYSQHTHLDGKGKGITITPYCAGHLLGGCLWKISKEGEDIVYAVDLNHKKDRHLNGTVVDQFNKPAVCITDAYTALNLNPPRKNRDQEQELVDSILAAVRRDGNVLLPVDTAGRVLELVLILEAAWAQHKLGNYQLVLYSAVAYHTMEFAKSHLEWMSDVVANSFDTNRTNAFNTRYLHLCHNQEEFQKLKPGPKVVLASMNSLEVGAARRLFAEWAPWAKNLILFTDHGQPDTLAREVLSKVAAAAQGREARALNSQAVQAAPGFCPELRLHMKVRVALAGAELLRHREAAAVAAAEAAARKAARAEAREAARAEAQAARAAASVALPSAHGWASADKLAPAASDLRAAGAGAGGAWDCLVEGFSVPEGAAGPMFPYGDEQKEWDDYGEMVREEDFAMLEDTMQDATREEEMAEAEEEKEAADPEAEPTRVVEEVRTVAVRAAVLYLDFEGRSDGRSMRTILAHLAPLQLVLVHGTAEAVTNLQEHCQRVLPSCKLHVPKRLETVDCSSASAAYSVKLSEELMSGTALEKVDAEHEVGWIDGVLGAPSADGHIPLLPLPPGAAPPPHKAAMVGTLKLSDFKQTLANADIPAEFTGGVLLCGGGLVTVRKDPSTQQVVLEGALCADYYKIRTILYSQYHIL